MLITARDLVIRLPDADERRVRLGLAGNLCRCTGYVGIVRAVRSVIAERRARDIVPEPHGGRTALGPAGSGHAACTFSQKSAVATPSLAEEAPAAAPLQIPDFTPATVMDQQF